MRTLLVLLAVLLSLGAYFSEHEPAPDVELPICVSATCKRHAPFRSARPQDGVWPIPPRAAGGDFHYECESNVRRRARPGR